MTDGVSYNNPRWHYAARTDGGSYNSPRWQYAEDRREFRRLLDVAAGTRREGVVGRHMARPHVARTRRREALRTRAAAGKRATIVAAEAAGRLPELAGRESYPDLELTVHVARYQVEALKRSEPGSADWARR